jgi:aspartate aminotransferase
VYRGDEIRGIADLAVKNDLFILSDEVYREFRFDNVEYYSPLHIEKAAQRVIITDSVSKRYSSCGARVGFVASPNREVMQAVLKYAMARLSPPTLGQVLAEAEFDLDFTYFDEVIAEYQERRDILYEELSKSDSMQPARPEGAFYMIVKLNGLDSEDFARYLLTNFSVDKETVMVAPAPGFYATPGLGTDEIRLAYVLNTEKTKRAARILAEGLAAYQEELRKTSGLLYTKS